MALNRPADMSQGRGLSGRPVCGQVVNDLFGEIEIADQAHQRSQNSARFRPVKSLYGPTQIFGRIRRHACQTSKRIGSTQLQLAVSRPIFQ
jgi:hypothetical protein